MSRYWAMSIMASLYLASPELQQLTADMREAMRRSGWDGKQTAHAIGASQQRVSDQLLDKEPFTLLCRFKKVPAVWRTFLLIQMQRAGSVVVLPEGYAATVYKLSEVTFNMAKAALPSDTLTDSNKERTA